MTTWAPQLPETNPREWTNVSRPISDVMADKSKAVAIGAAADVLGSVVKVTDRAFKDTISDEVRTGVEGLRDAYTQGLQDVRNMQLAASDKSLLPEAENKPPQPLQQGLERVKQIGTAMAQGGNKINDTLYTGALNSLAKQLRNQYPGYRDYIDEQIKSVSGIDPANAFMRNLMEDINRNLENSKSDVNATMSQLRSLNGEGFRDSAGVTAAQIMEGVRKGVLTTTQADAWIASAKTLEWNNRQREINRKSRLEDEADSLANATKDLSRTSAETIAHNWSTMTIGKGTDTSEGLFKFIQANAGNTQVQDERSRAIGMQLRALRDQTFKQIFEDANKGGSNSIVSKLGGDAEKAKKIIAAQFETWDRAIDAVFNKDWGTAYSHMQFNKAIAADSANLLYNAPDAEVRKYNRMVGAINEISPQFGAEFFKNMLVGDVPQREKEWLKNQKMELLVQPDAPMGKLTSIQGSINAAKAKGVTSPKTYSDLIDSVKYIADPKVGEEHRVNLIRGFFDPQHNKGLLSDDNFKMDYYDPARNRTIPGKYSVFTRLTSGEVTKAVAELNNRHPELAPMVRTSMEREFGEQLFSRELRDLGAANKGYTPSSLWKIAYVDEKGTAPRFEIVGPRGEPMTMTEAIALRAPVAEVNRINIGISGLRNVYAATGSNDPNVDILSTMYKYGYSEAKTSNNSPGRTESISEIPVLMWRALTSTQNERLRKVKGKISEPE